MQPTLLLDELAAELDEDRQRAVLRALGELGVQVLVTGTSEQLLERFDCGRAPRMFHVEQGHLRVML